jgi:hypothetical protein
MTYQEQIEKIIETHNLAPEANIADFVDNLVLEVEYYKARTEAAESTLATICNLTQINPCKRAPDIE